MELRKKRLYIEQKKEDIPPHILEMGLNMLFVEPKDIFSRFENGLDIVKKIELDSIYETTMSTVLLDISNKQYDEKLDKIALAKQEKPDLAVIVKDIILEEYQIYLHRIYNVDGIIFPLEPIASEKMAEKFLFICKSLGILAIPLIKDSFSIEKLSNWHSIKVVVVKKENIQLPKSIIKTKINSRGDLTVCSLR